MSPEAFPFWTFTDDYLRACEGASYTGHRPRPASSGHRAPDRNRSLSSELSLPSFLLPLRKYGLGLTRAVSNVAPWPREK